MNYYKNKLTVIKIFISNNFKQIMKSSKNN
jgi:hypothetical protein